MGETGTAASGLDRLEELLDRRFEDREVLARSLAHRSYCAENPSVEANERLEFLGDGAVQYDPDGFGGAVLLGIDGVCVISHGSSTAESIAHAVRLAAECAQAGFVQTMKEALAHGV